MQRFSAHNALAWFAGAAGVLAVLGLQLGFVAGPLGAVVLGLALVGGGYWVARFFMRHKHARRLREFALLHGWEFSEQGYGQTMGLTGFPFGVGESSRCEDVLRGRYDGKECASYTYVFDYRYGDGKRIEQVFTVTQTELPMPVPRLDVIPEDVGTRLLGAIGGSSINLESSEFNRKWRVLSADRRFAVDVVDPRMMEMLLRHHIPGLAIRMQGNKVLVWSAGRANVNELAHRLDVVTGFARHLPEHVVRAYTDADAKRRAAQERREANAPDWAKTPGVLNSGRYTGIGVDADGDGVDDWEQRTR